MAMNTQEGFPEKGTLRDQVLFALRYVVRAPSTHNSQPWLFHFNDSTLSIYADWSRMMKESDRDGRDLCISLGTCIEHSKTTFTHFGMLEKLSINESFEIGDTEPIATLTLHPSTDKDAFLFPFMQAIERRFNARGPFVKKMIPSDLMRTIIEVTEPGVTIQVITDDTQLLTFASLTGEGMRVAHRDPKFREELAKWMINNYSKKKDGIPGYTMLAPGLLSLILPTIIGKFNMGGLLSKLNYASISSSSGTIIFSSEERPSSWVHVGIAYARISLILNAYSVFTSVFVASIEMPEIRTHLKELLQIAGLPQFACVFGYPKITLRQSPRIPPEDRMI
ncbi:MAG: hypothetical protein UY04_C0006G0021 [Parcubacteria group bacterium GW2011_GWA2_47_7]|nr:MAG: hypothetical protein UY04_C0006G0021 [Parcubacteria group bacterium GW2011_GWA2_47_7]